MIIQINQELCLGCGICMDTCQSGAIFMDAQRAVIDIDLCNMCEVCIDACPNEAIAAIAGTPQATSIPVPNTVNIPVNMTVSQSDQLDTPISLNENKLLTNSVVSFLGSEVAPRLVNMAISVLDRRLTQSAPTTSQAHTESLKNRPEKGRMNRRRIRLRGRSGLGSEFSERS